MPHPKITVRPLQLSDLDAIIRLEHSKWSPEQSASEAMIRSRLLSLPQQCWGGFGDDGELLATVFVMRKKKESVRHEASWYASTRDGMGTPQDDGAPHWFGISITSKSALAQREIFLHMMVSAIKHRIRSVFLGSPTPGYAAAKAADAQLGIAEYVSRKRRHPLRDEWLPQDQQLLYYYQRGFTNVVAAKENYFHHPQSLDCGAVLECEIPLAWCHPLLRLLPSGVLLALSRAVIR